MANLTTDKNLDKYHRLVKSGGENTSLELATKGNGARVHGDLLVDGDIESDTIYPGQILGYTCLLNDAADTSYSTTTSFVVIHSSAKIRFIAPPSGNVEIFASVFCKWSSNRWLQFGLSDNVIYNTIDVTHEHFIGEGDETDEMQINHRWVGTGLIAGRVYTFWLGAKCEQASRATLYWGGDATGEYAPFIMKATALPIGIYTG